MSVCSRQTHSWMTLPSAPIERATICVNASLPSCPFYVLAIPSMEPFLISTLQRQSASCETQAGLPQHVLNEIPGRTCQNEHFSGNTHDRKTRSDSSRLVSLPQPSGERNSVIDPSKNPPMALLEDPREAKVEGNLCDHHDPIVCFFVLLVCSRCCGS